MDDLVFYELKFVNKQCEFDKIYTLRFVSEIPLNFVAGQWVHLKFPSEKKDKSRVRHMSFSSAPEDEFLEFTMDLGTDSWYKNQMARLVPGDKIRAFKVNGEFIINHDQKVEIIFLAGGIGITPVRSIIRNLQHKKSTIKWSLLHVSRKDFLFSDELSKLKNTQWRVHRNQIDSVWGNIVNKSKETKYFISGSERFVNGMKDKLETFTIEADRITIEDFNNQ